MIFQTLSTPKNHEICPWWKAYTLDNPIRKLFHPPRKVLAAYITEGMTVMDIGCGMGHFSIGMAKMVGESGKIIAVDLQQKRQIVFHLPKVHLHVRQRPSLKDLSMYI